MEFFCNLSLHTLRDQDFFAEFSKLMDQNRPPVRQLLFEVTQADFASQDPVARAHMDRLAELGFSFAVDQVTDIALDVGDYAGRHVRYVKIAAELLLSNDQRKDKSGIVGTLHRRLEQAEIQFVAEKIEYEEQVTRLLRMGMVLGQGYVFGQPKLSRGAS